MQNLLTLALEEPYGDPSASRKFYTVQNKGHILLGKRKYLSILERSRAGTGFSDLALQKEINYLQTLRALVAING